jgi:hypothetical protein
MKIVLFKPNGKGTEYHNITIFQHIKGGMLQFEHHDINGTPHMTRTNLSFVISADSLNEIKECDETIWGAFLSI